MSTGNLSVKWCGTLNNYTPGELLFMKAIPTAYKVIGKEIGELGTPHLQMFMYFSTKKSLKQMKEWAPRAHWETCTGSIEENKTYCKKDGDFEEIGVSPLNDNEKRKKGGNATIDLYNDAWEKAKKNEIESINSGIRLRCYNTLKSIAKDYQPDVQPLPNVTGVWLHGPSGAGKSHKAFNDYPNAYRKSANKWWDGYQGQNNVILDDLDISHNCLGHHLKLWADKWPFVCESKGSSYQIRPAKFVVTSQYTIEQIWLDQPTRDALNRRFVSILVEEPPAGHPPFVQPVLQPVVTQPMTELYPPEWIDSDCDMEKDEESDGEVEFVGSTHGQSNVRKRHAMLTTYKALKDFANGEQAFEEEEED